MRRTSAAIFFAALVGFATGCIETEIPPPGSYSEIMVVTQDGAGSPLAEEVDALLGEMLNYHISEDARFRVHHVKAADLEDVPYKSLVFVGPVDHSTAVGREINALLGPAAAERVRTGAANLFRRDDMPGRGQVTFVLAAKDERALVYTLAERGDHLVSEVEESIRERMRGHLLKKHNKELTREMYLKYGFTIRVPTSYRLLSDRLDPPGIELLDDGPSRLLGIFWLDWEAQPTLHDWMKLYRVRQNYVRERYAGDEMDSTRVRFSYDRLGEQPVVKMEGYWSNDVAISGGAYESYFVWDETNRLLWVLDLLVFAPGLDKPPLFRELLALAETFRYD
jgi:hypothetical protein